jgi:hypothetical protein
MCVPRIVFLGEQTQIAAQSKQLLEVSDRFVSYSLQDVDIDQTEVAGQKGALGRTVGSPSNGRYSETEL